MFADNTNSFFSVDDLKNALDNNESEMCKLKMWFEFAKKLTLNLSKSKSIIELKLINQIKFQV